MPKTNGDVRPNHSRGDPMSDRRVSEASVQPVLDSVRIKRAYERSVPSDGRRILIDRLWPRGLTKQDLADALWLRDVAPSSALRRWFGHKPERWGEFRARYFDELRTNPAVETLRNLAAAGPVTLIYGARDEVHNQAVALADFLIEPIPPVPEGK